MTWAARSRLFAVLLLALWMLPILQAKAQTTLPERENTIFLNVLRPFDPINPGIIFSYERKAHSPFATQVTAGLMTNLFGTTHAADYRGFSLAVEEKYFIVYKPVRTYLSAELAYLNAGYSYIGTFLEDPAHPEPYGPSYIDTFQVAKQTLALHTKAGIQASWKRLAVDISLGLGVKYKAVHLSELKNSEAPAPPDRHHNAWGYTNQPGNYFTLSLPVRVCIGYQF